MSGSIYYSIDFTEKIKLVNNTNTTTVSYIILNSNDVTTYTLSNRDFKKKFAKIGSNVALYNGEPILYIKRSKNN
jgi:hypothetical protein